MAASDRMLTMLRYRMGTARFSSRMIASSSTHRHARSCRMGVLGHTYTIAVHISSYLQHHTKAHKHAGPSASSHTPRTRLRSQRAEHTVKDGMQTSGAHQYVYENSTAMLCAEAAPWLLLAACWGLHIGAKQCLLEQLILLMWWPPAGSMQHADACCQTTSTDLRDMLPMWKQQHWAAVDKAPQP